MKHGWGGGAALEIMITCEGKLVQLILKQRELWCVAPRWSRVLHLGPWMSRFMENKVWRCKFTSPKKNHFVCVCVCVLRWPGSVRMQVPHLIALGPPARRWAPAAPAGRCSRWLAAGSRLPGRPPAARSAGAAGGACPPPDSPQKSNALCPGQTRPSGSTRPDPEGKGTCV